MNILLLLFCLYVFVCSPLYAEKSGDDNGVIKGIITTRDNKTASAVTVEISKLRKSTITDDKGEFVFKNIRPGIYAVAVTSIGFTKIEKEVVVEADKTVEVMFQLTVNAEQLTEILVTSYSKSYIGLKASSSLRLNADLNEVPQNITIATRQTLTDMGLLSKSEIFRISSAVTKNYGSDLDISYQIRGINATYSTFRNGIGGPVWWNAQEDASMIERLEFVKGPAGFMLANAEPGGLINVVTKQPTHQRITEVGVGLGSWNLMRTNLDLGGELVKDGKFTYRLNIGVEKKNEYYHFGEFYRYWICPVITYEPDKKSSLTYEFNYVKAAAQENTHDAITINGDFEKLSLNLAINDPNNPKFWGADAYNKLTVKHQFNANWVFNAQAGYMTTDWDGNALLLQGINATKDTLDRYNYFSDWEGELSNLQLFLDGKFNTGSQAEHKILIGIDYGHGNQGNIREVVWKNNPYPLSINAPQYYLPKDTLTAFHNKVYHLNTNRWEALYVQDHFKLFNRVILTLAGRFTHLRTGQNYLDTAYTSYEIDNNKFTPRLGLTYLFTKDISAYILHDECFLAQNSKTYEGEILPPITGRNIEVGVKLLLFDRKLALTTSVFDIRKNDVGTADPAHPGYYLKSGQIRSQGIDVDITGSINSNLFINANYAYADARITKDEDSTLIGFPSLGACKNISNIWFKYQVNNGALKGLGFGAGFQFIDKLFAVSRDDSNEGKKYLPAYHLFDASVSFTTGRFNIGFNIYNIANKRYATGGYWEPNDQEYVFNQGIPTNFRLQTTIRL